MTMLLALLLWGGLIPSDRTVVLVFTRTDCPISNRYAPVIQALYSKFSTKGIDFQLVYPESGVTQAQIDHHRGEYGYTMPGVADPSHLYVRQAQATITPEAAVFVKGRLVYRGRIDDRFPTLSQSRQKPTVNDLADVLTAIVSGHPPPQRFTRATGCVIEKQQ